MDPPVMPEIWRSARLSERNTEVRLRLHALAYDPGNFVRTLALPKEVKHWPPKREDL